MDASSTSKTHKKTDIHCPENFKSHTERFHFPLYVYFQTVTYHIGYRKVHQRLMHRYSGGTMTATHGLMPSNVMAWQTLQYDTKTL